MTAMTADKPAAVVPETITVDGDEILSEFAKVMIEWGHYKTATGIRLPTLAEARRVGGGRSPVRGWNTDPIPDARPLFQPR